MVKETWNIEEGLAYTSIRNTKAFLVVVID